MESVSLLSYKEALLQAAWETNVKYMATDDWGSSGLAETPLVAIGVPFRREAEDCAKKFREVFDREVGESLLINVMALSEMSAVEYSHVMMYDGEWLGNVR